jgi:hypothetical protein
MYGKGIQSIHTCISMNAMDISTPIPDEEEAMSIVIIHHPMMFH